MAVAGTSRCRQSLNSSRNSVRNAGMATSSEEIPKPRPLSQRIATLSSQVLAAAVSTQAHSATTSTAMIIRD